MVFYWFLNGKEKPDLISSHGHTVFHQPEKGITLQIGDLNKIASISGITTVGNFRSMDVAKGGQGAPLVPIGDDMLFSEYDYCVNLGGISNYSEINEGKRIAKVRIRGTRIPAMGDKFCSRAGQKGTVGIILPECDMPCTEDGIRPDIIVNPHAMPSRMTIGHLVETLTSKTACIYGGFGDCTAFTNKGPK